MIASLICAVLYSYCWLYEKNKSLIIVNTNNGIIELLFRVVVYWICFYGIYYIFANKIIVASFINKIFKKFYVKLNEFPFYTSSLTIALMWFPYFIAYSPGTAMWDTFAILNNMFNQVKTAHHPIFINFIMQGSLKLGKFFCNEEVVGMYFYIIIQYIFCACSIGYLMSYLVRYVQKKWFVILTMLFFGLLTVWPSYAMTMVKDTGFYALFLLFNVALVKLSKGIDYNGKVDKYIFLLSGTGIILFRNNGIYVILFMAIFLIGLFIRENDCLNKNILKNIAIYMCVIFVVGNVVNYLLMDTMGYLKGGKQEMLSIPFQQTARVVNKYPNEILNEEKEAINMVLNYDAIGRVYMPRKSDPVKWYYRFRVVETELKAAKEKEALKNYFNVWWKMFFKYPMTYLEATFANTYGYFYLPYIGYEDGWFFTSTNKKINNGKFKLYHFKNTKKLRDKLYNLRCEMKKSVLMKYFYSCGLYTLSVFFCFFVILKRNNQKLKTVLIFLPVVTIILTCIASPVNAYIRYYLPVMAVTPLFIGEYMIEE